MMAAEKWTFVQRSQGNHVDLVIEYKLAWADVQTVVLNGGKYQDPNAIVVYPTKLFSIRHAFQRDEVMKLFELSPA